MISLTPTAFLGAVGGSLCVAGGVMVAVGRGLRPHQLPVRPPPSAVSVRQPPERSRAPEAAPSTPMPPTEPITPAPAPERILQHGPAQPRTARVYFPDGRVEESESGRR